MFIVIGFMTGGMCVGFLFRRHRLSRVDQIITVLIWSLLFLLGIEVGGNGEIMRGLATLGMEALVISSAAVLGSCLAAKALWVWLIKKKKENR